MAAYAIESLTLVSDPSQFSMSRNEIFRKHIAVLTGGSTIIDIFRYKFRLVIELQLIHLGITTTVYFTVYPNTFGEFLVDVHKYIDDYLTSNPPFVPLPFAAGQNYLLPWHSCQYRLLGELWGVLNGTPNEPPTPTGIEYLVIENLWAIRGGFESTNYTQNNASGYFSIGSTPNQLYQVPKINVTSVAYNQHIFLCFIMPINSNEIFSIEIESTSVLNNISSISFPLDRIFYNIGEMVCVPLLPSKQLLDTLSPEEIASFKVEIYSGNLGTMVCAPRYFVFDRTPNLSPVELLWLNSAGGWDTMMMNGTTQKSLKYTKTDIVLGENPIVDRTVGYKSIRSKYSQESILLRSGWKHKTEIDIWVKEIMLSLNVYINIPQEVTEEESVYTIEGWTPVFVDQDSLTLYESDDYTFAAEIKCTYNFANHSNHIGVV